MIMRLNHEPVTVGKSAVMTASDDGKFSASAESDFDDFSGREKHR